MTKKQFLFLILVVAPLALKAAVTTTPLSITEISAKAVDNGGALLKLKIKDTKEKSGVCPYFVENLAFNKDKKELRLNVTQGFCPSEQFGKAQGELYWVVPKVAQGEKLCIYLNDVKMGSVQVQGNKKAYRLAESCE